MKFLNPLAKEGKINKDAHITDRQSIIINCPIERVWELMVNVQQWPEWNHDIKVDKFTTTESEEPFKWQIKGQSIRSTFQKVDPPYTLSWTSKSQLFKAVNVWKLERAGDQTIVSAEESIQGLSAFFFGHQKLHNTLLTWLSRLKMKAEE